jgi:hypothetical protein
VLNLRRQRREILRIGRLAARETVNSVRPWKAFLNATMPLFSLPNDRGHICAPASAPLRWLPPRSYRKRPGRQKWRRSAFGQTQRRLIGIAVAGMPELCRLVGQRLTSRG